MVLIVTAFKSMMGFKVTTSTVLLMICAEVLMLALSAWLLGQTTNR